MFPRDSLWTCWWCNAPRSSGFYACHTCGASTREEAWPLILAPAIARAVSECPAIDHHLQQCLLRALCTDGCVDAVAQSLSALDSVSIVGDVPTAFRAAISGFVSGLRGHELEECIGAEVLARALMPPDELQQASKRENSCRAQEHLEALHNMCTRRNPRVAIALGAISHALLAFVLGSPDVTSFKLGGVYLRAMKVAITSGGIFTACDLEAAAAVVVWALQCGWLLDECAVAVPPLLALARLEDPTRSSLFDAVCSAFSRQWLPAAQHLPLLLAATTAIMAGGPGTALAAARRCVHAFLVALQSAPEAELLSARSSRLALHDALAACAAALCHRVAADGEVDCASLIIDFIMRLLTRPALAWRVFALEQLLSLACASSTLRLVGAFFSRPSALATLFHSQCNILLQAEEAFRIHELFRAMGSGGSREHCLRLSSVEKQAAVSSDPQSAPAALPSELAAQGPCFPAGALLALYEAWQSSQPVVARNLAPCIALVASFAALCELTDMIRSLAASLGALPDAPKRQMAVELLSSLAACLAAAGPSDAADDGLTERMEVLRVLFQIMTTLAVNTPSSHAGLVGAFASVYSAVSDPDASVAILFARRAMEHLGSMIDGGEKAGASPNTAPCHLLLAALLRCMNRGEPPVQRARQEICDQLWPPRCLLSTAAMPPMPSVDGSPPPYRLVHEYQLLLNSVSLPRTGPNMTLGRALERAHEEHKARLRLMSEVMARPAGEPTLLSVDDLFALGHVYLSGKLLAVPPIRLSSACLNS